MSAILSTPEYWAEVCGNCGDPRKNHVEGTGACCLPNSWAYNQGYRCLKDCTAFKVSDTIEEVLGPAPKEYVKVTTNCPACLRRTLVVGMGGHLHCTNSECPDFVTERAILSLRYGTALFGRRATNGDAVNHPSHYGGDDIYEHIKVVRAWGLDYKLGNATKYICRAGKKSSADVIEDLRKAVFYIEHYIKELQDARNLESAEEAVRKS